MNTQTPQVKKRPRNKANMDQPQEEFIAPSGTHAEEPPRRSPHDKQQPSQTRE